MRRASAALLLGLLLAAPAPPLRAQDGKPAPAAAPAELPAPRFIGHRLPGGERDMTLVRNGGSADTEKAVDAGLDWLERHAEAEGGWDTDAFPARCDPRGRKCAGIGRGQHGEDSPCPFDESISALCCLAFLGDGVLPDPAGSPRAKLLEKSLRRLEGTADLWALPLATEAFAEAEAMERKGRWREAAAAGAKALLAARQDDGAWGYCVSIRKGSDTPYTALVAPALVAARDAGVALPADLGAGVDRFLNALEERKGKLAYLVDGRSYGYTPTGYNAHAALAVRELLRVGLDGPRHRAHLAFVRGEKPEWVLAVREVGLAGQKPQMVRIGTFDLVNWYYGTEAMFQRGGEDWIAWFGAARAALLGHQKKESCARGSWDPDGQYERFVGGRILSTVLGVLILEEPIRHRRIGN
jgi:hypothetical protein